MVNGEEKSAMNARPLKFALISVGADLVPTPAGLEAPTHLAIQDNLSKENE